MPIEPKLLRCPKGTRRNKKTGLCEPTLKGSNSLGKVITVPKGNTSPIASKLKESKVLRCPKGTRRNKKTGICDPTLKTRIGEHISDKEGLVSAFKSGTSNPGENPFIALCKKYIMNSKLDNVYRKVWMNKEDCNIFTIGEQHKPHQKCMSILDMFKKLLRENTKNPVHIDLLIELLPVDVYTYALNGYYDVVQMGQVRQFLAPCVQTKGSCSNVHVHWADTGKDIKDRLPKWIKELNNYNLPLVGLHWKENPDISRVLRNKEDVSKILTENVMTVKEINKAEKIFPNFTIKFAVDLFMGWVTWGEGEYGWIYNAGMISRWVMDFYTAARIIKSKFKNVIFYAGNTHTEHVIEILTKLGFSTVESVLGDNKCINY